MDYNLELIKRYGRVMMGGVTSPVILNILITSVCDMRCTHCFFTEELDDKERKKFQMTTEQLASVSKTLGGKLPILIIAGGEPFTRKDLPEVVRAFYENNQLESVYLMSNGGIQQRIIPDVTRILEECPKLNVTVALGIDGLKDEHEKIRGKQGSWDKAIGTARMLQDIQKDIPRLDVQTCTCFMNSNQDRIFEWYDFLRYELKPDKINVNYIRPPSKDAKELDIDLNRYRKLSKLIDDDSRNGVIKNHYKGESGHFKAAVDIYMHELIARTEVEQKAQLRCFAGTTGGVIYDEGTVSSCENLDPIGNLRNYNWDFQALWNSPEMAVRRQHVKNGCFCTHESNCYYPSLAFNPKHLIQIKKLERQLKKSHKNQAQPVLEPLEV
ncbi:MAG: radical SAM protein [Acidobacteria bacterium]|nr:radical SAM protein [Acidobacteriota bacterium]